MNFGDMVEIKDISGKTRFSTPINKGAKGKFILMKEDYIILPFSVSEPVYFKLGDYVDLSGVLDDSLGGLMSKRYEIVDLQKPTYNTSTGGYDYQLRLDSYYWKWKNKIFKYTPEQAGSEASWSLTATLDVQLGVFLRNLKALGYNFNGKEFEFSIDSTVENKAVAMTYDNINLLDALFSMAGEDKWNCDCWITDNVIHFGRNEFGDAVKIERGVEASNITRSESQGTYATRIYAFGSTKNIPTNYRPTDEQAVVNGVVQKRLMLPVDTPYIDAYEGMSQEEAIEDVVVFDDVYPRRVGTLSDVHTRTEEVDNEDGTKETITYYRYKDTGFEFKEEYIIEGQELKITFQSGKLNGMVFGVIFNPEPKDESRGEQLWEIVRNEDYGRPLPDDIIRPENGDEYILSGFDIQLVSDQYIPTAEQELKEKALKYAEIAKKDDGTYPTTLRSSWVKENLISRTFEFGQRINLVDDAYFENGRISRVLGWELSLDIPWDSPIYTIGESMPYSRIQEIEEKVDALTYKGQTYVGGGGSGVYIIRTNDSTSPSDSNVFSALRSLATLHRKDKTDENPFLQKFLKGIEIGKFLSGLLGTGGAVLIDEDGNSHAEFDYITIRKVAIFIELLVQQMKYVGGAFVVSPAGMTAYKVEDTGTVYRCYFKKTDEEKTVQNQFSVGAQARRQTFNLTSQAYYWRLVTAVGEDWIELSKTDCDNGSTIPQAGDEIVQLGHRTDKTLQSAIIISAYGTDAPSIKYYQGIDSYSLVDREIKADYYDPTTGRFKSITYGDTYIGAKDKSTFVSYDQDEGVNIKGKVSIQSGSSGVGNFEDLPDEIQKAIQIGAENLLMNTSFAGDYEPLKLSSDTPLKSNTDLYSPKLIGWGGNATVVEDEEATSGYAAQLGTISQGALLILGENYVISYKAKGTSVRLAVGNVVINQNLSSTYKRYSHVFTAGEGTVVTISGACTICDIKLERGTIATDWCPSVNDSSKDKEGFKALFDIQAALKGKTQFYGGLGLTTMIQLGVWENDILTKINAGISGICNNDQDVAYWAGGTYEEAIATVNKIINGETPTDDEWKDLARFVVTHGGDVFMRGYIYALGGYFRGLIDLGNGTTRLNADGTGWIGKNGNGKKFIEIGKNLFKVNGTLNAESGSAIGGLKVTEKGALYGQSAIFSSIPAGIFVGSIIVQPEKIKSFVKDNIDKSNVFHLMFNGANIGTYDVLLPNLDDLRSVYPELINSSYSFELTFFVPRTYLTINDDVTMNNAVFKIKADTGTAIYNNNGSVMSEISISKGDVLELYCTIVGSIKQQSIGGGAFIEYKVEYYIKNLRQ